MDAEIKNPSAPIAMQLPLTPKEELAVIAQRLKTHIAEATDERCKAQLDIAYDIIRSAIHRR